MPNEIFAQDRTKFPKSFVHPKLAPVPVSRLPVASVAGAGARERVSDAINPTFCATVVGGGAEMCKVFSDGTNWKVG